jgi:hemerythrin-like metal-binding protein
VCVRHFADEEAYMASIGYIGLRNHRFIHEELLGRYAGHAQEIRSAGGRPDQRFFHFLRHWLTAHIKGIDRKYAGAASRKDRAA